MGNFILANQIFFIKLMKKYSYETIHNTRADRQADWAGV